jgi:hypothetical protein
LPNSQELFLAEIKRNFPAILNYEQSQMEAGLIGASNKDISSINDVMDFQSGFDRFLDLC